MPKCGDGRGWSDLQFTLFVEPEMTSAPEIGHLSEAAIAWLILLQHLRQESARWQMTGPLRWLGTLVHGVLLNSDGFQPLVIAVSAICDRTQRFQIEADCARGRRIDPSPSPSPHGGPLSYFSIHLVLHDWWNKGCGWCYSVCGMVIIGKSSPCGDNGFHLNGPLPNIRRHMTVMCVCVCAYIYILINFLFYFFKLIFKTFIIFSCMLYDCCMFRLVFAKGHEKIPLPVGFLSPFITLQQERKNVLFNDALNTFYLRLYGVEHTVKSWSTGWNEK